jgi:predicted nucleic-acid-binding protein
MNGVDTNVLSRLLLRDDEDQARRADAFVERSCSAESPCLVNRVVLVEVVWVLQSGYGYDRDDVATIIENILRTEVLTVEGAPEAWAALADYPERAADFADLPDRQEQSRAGLRGDGDLRQGRRPSPGIRADLKRPCRRRLGSKQSSRLSRYGRRRSGGFSVSAAARTTERAALLAPVDSVRTSVW